MTKSEEKELLKEAVKRGFVSDRYFVSATGIPDCLVLGKLKVKNFQPKFKDNPTPEELEDMKFNGDVVSESGYGVIYDATLDVWGEVVDFMVHSTSSKRNNFRKVTFRDDDTDE